MLHDIFSSKTKKQNKKLKITADIHEKDSLVFSELIALGLDLEIMPLEVADFLVNNIAIERKTTQDFISSMISKRLFLQLKELSQYKNRLLIIEGEFEENKLSNAIKGMLLHISLELQTPIIYSKNTKETALYLYLLAKKQEKPLTLHSRKGLSEKENIKYILESFPSIGPKTAEKLLKEFKNLKSIFNSPKEDLEKTLGKKAEAFNLLEEDY